MISYLAVNRTHRAIRRQQNREDSNNNNINTNLNHANVTSKDKELTFLQNLVQYPNNLNLNGNFHLLLCLEYNKTK